MSAEPNAKLTPKQAIFIAEYLVDSNATRAAIAAGFAAGSADVTGARLLKNAKVAKALALRHARLMGKLEITAERTLGGVARIAYGDVGELLGDDGQLLPLQQMTEAARALVAGLEVLTSETPGRVRNVTHKVKIADRLRALEMLMKHQMLLGDGSFGATVEMAGGLAADSTIKIVLVRPAE